MKPVLQVALDFVDLDRAMKCAKEAAAGGADWLEAGTPLVKSEGLAVVRALREAFPGRHIVADLKVMDAGRTELEMAAKAGANSASVLGLASDATIKECVAAGKNYGIEVDVDLIGTADPAAAAARAERLGAAGVGVHLAIDEQMLGRDPFEMLRAVRKAVGIRVAVAGGINSESAAEAVKSGADVVIVGGALTKSSDAAKAARDIKRAMETGQAVATELFKRSGADGLRATLARVSTANISDGAHRRPCLEGIRPLAPDMKLCGPAFTVRSFPGDWAKPVEAIDLASPGDVLVIDAGGVGPALWGELATNSAIQRKLAGVVVDGAVRDAADIAKLGFPVFTRLVMSNAGEPRGFGEIGVAVRCGGQTVSPGDWIAGDNDGVMVLPRAEAVEMANHAADCLEKENRIRGEITGGQTTLAKVTSLLKWEKIG
jgi:3-hexulose-6-phosphate synthase / 6-phospho-3-hexuloisomerase